MKYKDNEIIDAKKLKAEMDRERGDHLPEINGIGNTYARLDKSFSNSIDFFVKLIRRERNRKNNP